MFTYLKAPFPYFGGKATVADVVWKALGQPKHYIEPFFGSGAVLLNRPDYNPQKHLETVCDKDGHVANAWRGSGAGNGASSRRTGSCLPVITRSTRLSLVTAGPCTGGALTAVLRTGEKARVKGKSTGIKRPCSFRHIAILKD